MATVQSVASHRDEILRIAARYGVRRVRLFGSVSRGDARPDSDIDLLVELAPGRSLLDQVGFQQDVEELLGLPVDVVVEGGISPYLEASILNEAQPL